MSTSSVVVAEEVEDAEDSAEVVRAASDSPDDAEQRLELQPALLLELLPHSGAAPELV